MMKRTVKSITNALRERAEEEWGKLLELEKEYHKDSSAEELRQVGEQRARWAAWDSAAEVAEGKDVTSFETEQESV